MGSREHPITQEYKNELVTPVTEPRCGPAHGWANLHSQESGCLLHEAQSLGAVKWCSI